MQGTVLASLMCTCTMDKLVKEAYSAERLLYKYKNEVLVPPLEMVHDKVAVVKCGKQKIQP